MNKCTLAFSQSIHIPQLFQKLTALLLLLFFASSIHSFAQTDSVYWNFGTPGNSSAVATGSSYAGIPAAGCMADTGNVCCAFGSASGYTTLYFTTQFSSTTYPGASGEPTMRNNAKTGGLNAATSTYFSFTVTPATGTTVEIKEIYFGGLKSIVGPGNYAIRTSVDGYAANVGTGTLATSYGSSKKAHTGLSIQGSANVPITVRIYLYNNPIIGTGGNVFIDDVAIYYDATTVIPNSIVTGSLGNNSLCAGTSVTIPYTAAGTYNSGNIFTAQLSDATGSFSSPVNIGTVAATGSGNINATIPALTPPGNGYRIRVVSDNPAITGSDNGSNITVIPAVTPTVAVTPAPGSTICAGNSVTFTSSVTNGSISQSYTWKKNGFGPVATTPTYTDNGLVNGDIITLEFTSNAVCAIPNAVSSAPIVMMVNTLVTPSVSITNIPANPVCAGTAVTFTATPVNEGTAPVYHWKKNNITVGGNTDTYIDNNPANGDMVMVEMTSSEACVTAATVSSNTVTMTVNPNIIPSVSITAFPGNDVCEGTPVVFTATPLNGGATPVYQWKINGNDAGINSNTFTSSTLSHGNIVTVEITSSLSCAITTPTSSNAIKMIVSPTTPPAALLTVQPADSIIPGQNVMFTLYIADGGNNPAITWLKNGIEIPGVPGNIYSTNTLAHNDTIKCFVQSSNSCATPDTTTSNAYHIHYIGTGIINQASIDELYLYPNPNNGSFTIEGNINSDKVQIVVKNILGPVVYNDEQPVINNMFRQQIDLSNAPKGSYIISLHTANNSKVSHFIIK